MADGLRPQMGAFRRAVMAGGHIMGVSGLLPQDGHAGMVHGAVMVRAVVAVSVALCGRGGSEAGQQGADAAQRQPFSYCKCHFDFLLSSRFVRQG